MAAFKVTIDDAIDEVRQRCMAVKSGTVDPSKWSDDAIQRRLNLKHLEWLGWLQNEDPQYATKRTTLTVSGLDPTEGEYLVDLPEDFRAQWRLYKKETDGRLIPVTLVAPRDEAQYSRPSQVTVRNETSYSTYVAYIEGSKIWFVREGSTSGQTYIGDYQLRYYYYPVKLERDQSPEMESLLPNELDEVWIQDTSQSLMSDGDRVAGRALADELPAMLRKFYGLYKKKDSARMPRIKDVMRYGAAHRIKPRF